MDDTGSRGRDERAVALELSEDGWELDDEAFLAEWDAAMEDAIELLRETLPELRNLEPPEALTAAAASLRGALVRGGWIYTAMRRAAGWTPKKLPRKDRELWLGAVGGVIEARKDTGLDVEQESAAMTLELADWLGAVIGLVRAGVGASAEPEDLIRYIDDCPEIEGGIDPDDESLVAFGFEVVLPAWEAAGALDAERRLTELGRWGLPRALAWAWHADFDAAPAASSPPSRPPANPASP